MRPFSYIEPLDAKGASEAFGPGTRYLAGGTNLLDLMKEGVETPSRLIALHRIALTRIDTAEIGSSGAALSIGASALNSDTANHPRVRHDFPLLSQAILAGASPQIRNMATAGGNLNQRTRCTYFYEPAMPCNKRAPGTGCSARAGVNRLHAVFGWSDACVAIHPSDMCVALSALDAKVHVLGTDGETRQIAVADYHRLPGDEPQRDNRLALGELVTEVTIPFNRLAKHSCYLKVRERTSYAFALVSVAAALEVRDGRLIDVRVALGGVAHKPWRAYEAERLLHGELASDASFGAAANAEMASARPLSDNRYKVELGRRLIVRALQTALAGTDRSLSSPDD